MRFMIIVKSCPEFEAEVQPDPDPVVMAKVDPATGAYRASFLPAGNYTFRVRTDTGGGEATVNFRIAPPWYRSNWAALVYCLLAAGLFWAIEIFNRRRLQRQRQRLESEKEHEILVLEVENKSRELSNAALNLIRKKFKIALLIYLQHAVFRR